MFNTGKMGIEHLGCTQVLQWRQHQFLLYCKQSRRRSVKTIKMMRHANKGRNLQSTGIKQILDKSKPSDNKITCSSLLPKGYMECPIRLVKQSDSRNSFLETKPELKHRHYIVWREKDPLSPAKLQPGYRCKS